MATQSASGSRDTSMNTKVAVPAGKASIGTGIRQPRIGKETGSGMESMPGSKGTKGQAVSTVKSNPPVGKASPQGNTAMGNGGVKGGFI